MDKITLMGVEGKSCEGDHNAAGAKALLFVLAERGPEGPLFHVAVCARSNPRTLQLAHVTTRDHYNSRSLQFAPHVFEFVEAFFSGKPFCGAHCAFGEAAAGFRVVAEIDAIGGRLENEFVQTDDIAFAE